MWKTKKYWKQQSEFWHDRYLKMLEAYGKLDDAKGDSRPYLTIGAELQVDTPEKQNKT